MRVLITQPKDEAAVTARALSARGHEPITIPLVTVEREASPKINLANAQAFLAISPEGVRALAEHVGVRTFPIFVDCDLTAAEARSAGFRNVFAAKDESQDLARLIERSLKPASGALVYACSTAAPVNLPAILGNMGFAVRSLPLYSIKRVTELPRELREKLGRKVIDVALFLSPDEARAFVTLIQRDENPPPVAGLKTVAATPAIAAPLRALKGTSITVAVASDPESVWATLDGELIDRVEEERLEHERKAKEDEERRRAEEERRRKEDEDRARIAREKAEAERSERERVEAERAAAERMAAEQAERERIAREEERRARAEEARAKREQEEKEKAERLAREKVERELLAAEKAVRDQAEREQRERERVERELIKAAEAARAKVEKERVAAERAALKEAELQRARAEREERERLAAEEALRLKRESERIRAERAEEGRLRKEREALERAERERIKAEEAARAKADKERVAAERAALGEAERQRIRAEREARERQGAEEALRLKLERERLAAERAEQERLRKEQEARERAELARIKAERAAQEKAEREQLARETAARDDAERERIRAERAVWEEAERARRASEKSERDRLEAERLAREKIESAARERERAERERLAREEDERVRAENQRLFQEREKERLERERIAREEAQILHAEQERLAGERAEAERIEREKRAEAARIEKEQKAEAERIEKEKRAEVARIEKERQALEKAERERIAREQADRIRADQERVAAERAEAERIEKERQVREKAERERLKAEQAALEAERKRIAREEAAAEKTREEQARRAEEERLALEFAQRRRREQEEATRLRAERRRISEEQKAAAQAEKARRNAERPQSPGWTSRLGAWMAGTPSEPPPEPAADPRWSMVVSHDQPLTPVSSAVAESPPSWNDAPMTDPIRETDETAKPPAAPDPSPSTPDEVPITRVPLALVELNELVERESAGSRKSGALPSESEPLADAKPAARGGGGRSAQMLAEDAADDRARDRHLNWGRGEPPPETLEGGDEPHVRANPEIVAPSAARRRGSGRTVALFFVLATAATAAMMTFDRWLPLLFGEPQTSPVATGPAPQIKPSVPPARPAPVAAAPAVPQSASPAIGQIAPSAPSSNPITNQTIAALMARIATLEAALGNAARLEEIDRRVNALAGRSADASSVLALSDRVAALEQAGRSAADARATAVALTIAAVQWRDAVVTGQPFLKEWDTVKALTGDTKTNAVIAKYASAGLPTLAELQRRFDAVAAGTVRANYLPDDTTGWVRRTLERIFSVVTIRRTDVDVGDDVEPVLVRADRAVDVGDLAGAVGEMKKLTGAPLAAATPWIELAEARETAEQAAHEAVIAAAAALAVPPQTPTPPKAE